MVILGIDPGYAIVGYGVIRAQNGRFVPLEHGAIVTKAGRISTAGWKSYTMR